MTNKSPIVVDEYITIYLKLIKENQKISTCNQLDLETLGSVTDLTQNLLGHLGGGD